MEKKSYGVLMSRNKINDYISVFNPLYLIEGLDTGEEFETDLKYCYPYVTDVKAFTTYESNLSISHIISEEDLLGIYQGVPLSEAKTGYFSSVCECIHIGYYIDIEDKVIFKSYDGETLFSALTGMPADLSPNNGEESIALNNHLSQEILSITISEFEKLLATTDDKTLREQLENLKLQHEKGQFPIVEKEYQKTICPTLDYSELTGLKILSFFFDVCDRMINAGSLNQIFELESNLDEVFENVLMRLDICENTQEIESSKATLNKIIDSLALITVSEDLAVIKKQIRQLYTSERDFLWQVAHVYDKYENRFIERFDVEDIYEVKSYQIKRSKLTETETFIGAKKGNTSKKLSASEMKKFFDARISGQEDAKKTIISAVIMNSLSEVASDRISCFLVGPPGSGKTLIAETLRDYLDLPCEIIDTTQLTSPGYVGRDIEDFLSRLVSKAGGDLEKAEKGIVVFNELDKKGSDKKSDVSGQAVLNCLLSFFEGTTYQVKYGAEKLNFNTSRLTIFATGACTDVAKAKLQKEGLGSYKNTKIGFIPSVSSEEEEDFEYPELERDDFVKYGGMTDEIMGRITTICQLSGHTAESLKFILTNIETSPLLLLKKDLAKIGVSVKWEEKYLQSVAEQAIKLKTGARSLKSTVEKSVKEARWEILTNPGKYIGILLTAECVQNPFACKLIDKRGKKYTVQEIVEASEQEKKVKKIGLYHK